MIVGCFGQLNGENNRDELKTCGFKVENLWYIKVQDVAKKLIISPQQNSVILYFSEQKMKMK
jgi:hypothetical protein